MKSTYFGPGGFALSRDDAADRLRRLDVEDALRHASLAQRASQGQSAPAPPHDEASSCVTVVQVAQSEGVSCVYSSCRPSGGKAVFRTWWHNAKGLVAGQHTTARFAYEKRRCWCLLRVISAEDRHRVLMHNGHYTGALMECEPASPFVCVDSVDWENESIRRERACVAAQQGWRWLEYADWLMGFYDAREGVLRDVFDPGWRDLLK